MGAEGKENTGRIADPAVDFDNQTRKLISIDLRFRIEILRPLIKYQCCLLSVKNWTCWLGSQLLKYAYLVILKHMLEKQLQVTNPVNPVLWYCEPGVLPITLLSGFTFILPSWLPILAGLMLNTGKFLGDWDTHVGVIISRRSVNGLSKSYKTLHYPEECRGMKLLVFGEGEGHKIGFPKEQSYSCLLLLLLLLFSE